MLEKNIFKKMKENSIIYKFVEIEDWIFVRNIQLIYWRQRDRKSYRILEFFSGSCSERNLKKKFAKSFSKKHELGTFQEFWKIWWNFFPNWGIFNFFSKEKVLLEEILTMVKTIRKFSKDFCNVFNVEVILNSNWILNIVSNFEKKLRKQNFFVWIEVNFYKKF